MTDFHTHLLPGIDDGSRDVQMSLAMLDMWREQEIDRLCATPHFYADEDTPEEFFSRRGRAYDDLMAALAAEGKSADILLGAEVRFFYGISRMEMLDRFCLEGTNLLLLEMPFTRWTDRMLDEVSNIRRSGVMPVAAHLERYIALNPARLMRRFMDMDIMIQCNAEFFLSRGGRRAVKLLADGRVHFLGSDAHNTGDRRPNLGPALALIERTLGMDALDRLAEYEQAFLPGYSEEMI